ncbi:AzlD domain-containing protein [Streptomyces sp. NPDC059853]|uniref:AzlD domain-containing protein n=1 Tax=Streptomyces sp. NPDC059853 TaxID=3346973 RepID=UPI003658BCD8
MLPLTAIAVLAAGTLAFRLAGPLLHHRLAPGERTRALLADAATVLLVALVATAALTEGQGAAGWSRPAGVLVGGALALRRAPLLAVVVAAAGTTAVLRLLGVP